MKHNGEGEEGVGNMEEGEIEEGNGAGGNKCCIEKGGEGEKKTRCRKE